MRYFPVPAGLALACLLAACVEVVTPPAPPAPVRPSDCGAAKYQDLVGQDAVILRRRQFGVRVRVIEPDTAVTMDYMASRLNFWIDRNGLIERVTCG